VDRAAQAQTPRDVTIERIEAMYLSGTVLTPDSPCLKIILASTRDANSDVPPDEWARVSGEVSLGVSQAFAAKGGLIDVAFRASVRDLSDDEIDRLERVLSDPTYQKFQEAMRTPQTQGQLMQAIVSAGLIIDAAVNTVLSRHGLKEVH
jgi:hypothetical protein